MLDVFLDHRAEKKVDSTGVDCFCLVPLDARQPPDPASGGARQRPLVIIATTSTSTSALKADLRTEIGNT